jgi:membrane protein
MLRATCRDLRALAGVHAQQSYACTAQKESRLTSDFPINEAALVNWRPADHVNLDRPQRAEPVRLFRTCLRVAIEALRKFIADEGWAIASHIALSILMALFPFLIVLASLAGFFGSKELADAAARILLDAWPPEVAAPLTGEINAVLTGAPSGALTFGLVFAVYFASSGIESLRIGLNRAYGLVETRSFWRLRLESIGYVLLGAFALLALAFLVVLAPLILQTLARYAPWLRPFGWMVTFGRYAVASLALTVALVIVHLWLPAGRRRLRDIAPGVIATLLLWLVTGELFGRYLARFAYTYAVTYAGLASAMIALVFLYCTACIFIYGGELSAAILRQRAA